MKVAHLNESVAVNRVKMSKKNDAMTDLSKQKFKGNFLALELRTLKYTQTMSGAAQIGLDGNH